MSPTKVRNIADGARTTSWVDGAITEVRAERAQWGSSALTKLIARAEQSWRKLLFPTTKLENWKYTSAEAVANGAFRVAPIDSTVTRAAIDSLVVTAEQPHLVVLVNGRYRRDLSSTELEAGLSILTANELKAGLHEGIAEKIGSTEVHDIAPFAALSTLLMQDIVVVSAARGVKISRPVQVLSVVTGAATGCVVAPRILIAVDALAEVSVIETYASLGAVDYLSLPVVESLVAEQGRLTTAKIECEDLSAFHVAHSATHHARASFSRSVVFSFGGKLVRNSADIELKGTGCDATINGLTVLNGEQHVDNTTSIHHIEPACESRELFKGIYAARSKGVFSGTIVVESEAQKTNAFQSNQTLLLSPTASIDTRPQLKIWADDVKCTHGATVGQLDEMALFYLRSRGIGHEEARRCLVKAFAGEVVSSLESAGLQEYVMEVLTRKLESVQENYS